jgi:hypothetical protein
VQIYQVEFPVVWADLGDDQGQMSYEPEPGGAINIKIHQRFQGTDWAWLVLFHEMCHAALAVAGTSELIGNGTAEESIVVSLEAVWRALAVAGEQVSKRACRGSKGRTPRARKRSTPKRRRPSRQ